MSLTHEDTIVCRACNTARPAWWFVDAVGNLRDTCRRCVGKKIKRHRHR